MTRNLRLAGILALLALCAGVLAATGTAGGGKKHPGPTKHAQKVKKVKKAKKAKSAKSAPAAAGRLDHVFVIMLENHSKSSVIDDPNAPFITSLAHTYAMASNYYGVTHPSQPNYIAATSGSNWWVNNDNATNRYDHTNIVDQLEATHHTWAAYMDAMPSTGFLRDQWPDNAALYVSKHDPFVLYDDIRSNPARLAHIKPYTQLAADLNRGNAPDYVWITPDQCHDMHGGVFVSVPGHPETPCPYGTTKDDTNDAALKQKADAFVKDAVNTITHSKAWNGNSAIFILTDENDFTGNPATDGWETAAGCCDSPFVPANDPDVPGWAGGTYGGGLIPAVVVTTHGKRGFTSTTPYNHYSLLATIEQSWSLGYLGFASDRAQVSTMQEFFTH